MATEMTKTTGNAYQSKMNNLVTQALQDWWSNLSKEELLKYLAEQPSLTADHIRDMLSSMNTVLSFDISLNLNNMQAEADFHTEE